MSGDILGGISLVVVFGFGFFASSYEGFGVWFYHVLADLAFLVSDTGLLIFVVGVCTVTLINLDIFVGFQMLS